MTTKNFHILNDFLTTIFFFALNNYHFFPFSLLFEP